MIGLVATAFAGVALAIQCYEHPIIGGSRGGGLRSLGNIIGAIGGSIADLLPSWHTSDSASGEDTPEGADNPAGANNPPTSGTADGESTKNPEIAPRPDVEPQSGGRSGENVKDLRGPPNSAIPGNGEHIFITDAGGHVIVDVTPDRAKDVIPGQGFGDKRPPTQQELELWRRLKGI